MSVVEVEISTANQGGLFFPPLGRRLRGRLDASRLRRGDSVRERFPDVLDGEILGVDLSKGECYTREPLAEPKFAGAHDRIKRLNQRLRPQRETVKTNVDAFLFWMRRAVQSGHAVVKLGTMPTDTPKPSTDFILKSRKHPLDRLAERVEKQDAVLEKIAGLLEKLASKK